MSWQEITMDEITSIVTKGTTPTTYGMPFTEEGVNFVKAEALNGDSSLDRSGFTFISEETHDKLLRSQLKEDDVLMTIAGANVGRCGLVKSEHLPANTNQAVALMRVIPEKADPHFVYYHFKRPSMLSYCRSLGGQAAQPNVNLGNLKKFKLSLPDLTTQKRIAGVLSAYDDLIENNRRRVALLEEAARLIYREWFVHLRFPGYEHVKITNGVPEGWTKAKIRELTTKLGSGATPRGGAGAYKATGTTLVRSLNVYDHSFHENGLVFIDDEQAKKLQNVVLEEMDVLLNITGASVARCCIVPARHLPARVNQHVMIVRADPKKCPPLFLLHSINAHQNKEKLLSIARSGGATREALTKDVVAEFEVILPPDSLLELFDDVVLPMFLQCEKLSATISELTKARDLLLPRLMDGRLEI